MVKNIKLNTFFFKEYAQIAEKNTYSAYIPNESKGIWCIADFDEKTNEKMQEKLEISQKIEKNNVENKKIDKINLAKIGVHKIIEKYLENNEFSLENIKQMIQSSIDKVIFEKAKLYKFHKAEKDVDRKSKLNVEQNLSEQIKASEKKLGKVIPFLSIFVEDIEMEKNYELLEKKINEKNQKQEKVVKYIFLTVIFVFMFVSVGKNIQKGNLKGERKEKVKNIMAEKIIEKANLMKNNLNKQSEIERNKVKQKNIEDEVEKTLENSDLVENEEVKNKKLENEEIEKNYKVKSNGISQLEKEIEKNWEVLGRDRNGNNFVKNREFKREKKNGFFIKGNNIEWEV